MTSIQSLCNCDTVSAYVESCCFNPTIYFVCKLCGGVFESVEMLLLHKRQEHTLNELKGIEFIVFEESFVESDANTFPSALLSTSVEFKCEVLDTTGDTNSDQHLHQVENQDIETIVDIPSKSGEIKLTNPYVYLRRLSARKIRSYSRHSRPSQNIQHNKTDRKIFRKRDLPALVPVYGRAQAAPDDLNAEIQVAQTTAVSPNDLGVEVEVIDREGDNNDYECQDVSCSGSEFEESVDTVGVGTVGVGKRIRIKKDVPIPAIYAHCRLSIKEWVKKDRATNPENIICLDPDPFQRETDDVTDTDANVFVVTTETPLKCKLCSKTLTSNAMAKSHLNYCWLNNKRNHFYCPICPKYFKYIRCLYRHNRLKHPKPGDRPLPSHNRRIKCTVCSKEFNMTKLNFRKHMETHEKPNEKNFFCEICGSGFRDNYGLERHHLTHSEEPLLMCKLCPKTFKNNRGLSLHMEVHAKDKNYHCLTCSKSFVSQRRLREHSRVHLNDKRYSCKVENCNLKFLTRTSVSYHWKRDHQELFSQMAKFSCTVCNEKFEYSSLLKKHEMLHSGQRPFKCSAEGCNRAFRGNANLEEHLRQHTGERPFQCDKCGNGFWRKPSFDKHMKAHNNPPDQVLCHLCPRKFPHNYELQQHLIFHKKGKQFLFQCDTCGFKCMTKAGLKGHLKTHDKAKDDVDNDEEEATGESASQSESESESFQNILLTQ